MDLKNLILQDVFRYKQAEFDLDRKFVLFQGDNGAGKSSIFEAISYALYGYTVRWGKTSDEIMRRGQKDCFVLLDFVANKKRYRIKRGRHNTEKNTNPILELGLVRKGRVREDLTGKTVDETNKKILAIVGSGFEVFRNSVMFGQNDESRWVTVPDTERKALIGSILSFGRLDVALKRAKGLRVKADEVLQKVRGSVAYLEERLGDWTVKSIRANIRRCQNEIVSLESDQGNYTKRLNRIQQTLSMFEQGLDEFHRLEAESSMLQSRLNTASNDITFESQEEAEEASIELEAKERRANVQLTRATTKRDTLNDTLGEAKAEKERLDRYIKTILKGMCHECGQEYKAGNLVVGIKQKALAEAEITIRETKPELIAARKLLEGARLKRDDIRDDKAAASAAIIALKAVEGLKQTLESSIKRIDVLSQQLLPDSEGYTHDDLEERNADLMERRDELKVRVEGIIEGIKDYQVELARFNQLRDDYSVYRTKKEAVVDAEAKLEHTERLVQVFGQTGVRHKLVETVLPELERLTNEYLGHLDDSGIYVEYSGTSETKGGDKRELLAVYIYSDGLRSCYEDYSGGEKKRILIASTLALAEIVRRHCAMDFLLVDELFGSLDEYGRRKLSELLVLLNKRFGSIFVISHRSSVKEWFNDVVTIRKAGGVSRVESG